MLPVQMSSELPSRHGTLGLFWKHLGLRETPSHPRRPSHKEGMAYLNTQAVLCTRLTKFYVSDLGPVGPGSRVMGSRAGAKSEVEVCPNPNNLVLRPAGVGPFPPCPGPACSSTYSLTAPTSAILEVVT